jgi:ferredoxin
VFALADRFAPGKIKAVGDRSACEECGLCTAVCESHIRVHTELTAFGRVVSPACLKDLDCVSVCPNGSITYGFTTPSFFKSWRTHGRFGLPYDFTLAEDIVMAAVFIAALLIFRGLYDVIPFLLTLGIGGMLAYAVVLSLRLFRLRDVRLNVMQLKRGGRLTSAGVAFAAVMLGILAATAHSGVIRYHEASAKRGMEALAIQINQQQPLAGSTLLRKVIDHLKFGERWGLTHSPKSAEQFATAYLWNDQPLQAEPYVQQILQDNPGRHDWRITFAAILLMRRQPEQAQIALQEVLARTRDSRDEHDRVWHDQAQQMLDELARAVQSSVQPSDQAGVLQP